LVYYERVSRLDGFILGSLYGTIVQYTFSESVHLVYDELQCLLRVGYGNPTVWKVHKHLKPAVQLESRGRRHDCSLIQKFGRIQLIANLDDLEV